VPREHEVIESATGLVTIAGGKLTTYRVMARQTVDVVARRLSRLDGRRRAKAPRTDREPLPGGELADFAQLATELEKEGLPRAVALHLVAVYGAEAAAVANLVAADQALATPLLPGEPWIMAEIVHQARREMAVTVSDVLIRRTRLFHHHPSQGRDAAATVARLLAAELGWSRAQADESVRHYEDAVQRMRAAFRGAPA